MFDAPDDDRVTLAAARILPSGARTGFIALAKLNLNPCIDESGRRPPQIFDFKITQVRRARRRRGGCRTDSVSRMSDAGDDIQVDAAVEVTTEAPKGKLSVEDALQVSIRSISQGGPGDLIYIISKS